MDFWTSLIDWFTVVYPIFTALAAIGSVVAIIFLWLNLVQMRKQLKEIETQKRLEHRGILAVSPVRIQTSSEERPKALRIHYNFPKVHRLPLLLIDVEWWASIEREVEGDIRVKYERLCRGGKKLKGPIIPSEEPHFTFPSSDAVADLFDRFAKRDSSVANENFFVHSVFGYEDALEEVHWVYMRWCAAFEISAEGKKEIAFSREEYRRLNG